MVIGRKVVEAIHEGRLIRAYEDDAIREGLFILRTVDGSALSGVTQKKVKPEEEKKALFDDFRRPLRVKDNITRDLADNFHWMILEKRRSRNMSRKQLAQAVRASENDIKLLENGMLPSPDFVMISRLEQYFGISLRKSGIQQQTNANLAALGTGEKKQYAQRDFRKVVDKVRAEKNAAIDKPAEQMVEEIEIIDSEE